MSKKITKDREFVTVFGFSFVLALSVGIIFLILLQLDKWNEESFELIVQVSKEAEYTHTMRDAIRKRQLSMQRMLNVSEVFKRDEEYIRHLAFAAEFAEARENIQRLNTNDDIRYQYQLIQEAINRAQPKIDGLVEQIIHGDLSQQALTKLVNESSAEQNNLVRLLDRLVELQRERYVDVVNEYQSRRHTVLLFTVAIFFISIIVAILVVRFSSRQYKYVSRLSVIDDVTGTYNRRYFDMIIEEEWQRSMRNYTPISLIMIDIDFFKDYNDKYGHQMGDVCLYSIAKILSGELKRASDFIARYGGEEFVIVLPNTNAENARLLGSRLRRAVEEARIKAGVEKVSPWVTVSIGVATTTAEFGQHYSVLVKAADSCLYDSKSDGRNRVTEKNLSTVDVK